MKRAKDEMRTTKPGWSLHIASNPEKSLISNCPSMTPMTAITDRNTLRASRVSDVMTSSPLLSSLFACEFAQSLNSPTTFLRQAVIKYAVSTTPAMMSTITPVRQIVSVDLAPALSPGA